MSINVPVMNQRERFEAWWNKRAQKTGINKSAYSIVAKDWAREAWQAACPEGFVALPEKITAESGHKYALIGEFHEAITLTCPECQDCDELDEHCHICSGEGEFEQPVPVTWDTIKRIHDAIVAAAPKPGDA